MAGTVRHANLETRTARARLKRGRQAHWRAILPGRAHLGYQRWPGAEPGRWVLRRLIEGKYRLQPLALADDVADADGERVYSFEQAHAAAVAALDAPKGKHHRITVR